jgi:cytosine permease
MAGKFAAIASNLDKLYEFDRESVRPDKLQSFAKFAGMFAGEHVAATEFVIGAFFVLHGVTARDLIWGLLLGNLLAVLSWTFICAPIAVRTRLTLYWDLRRIVGPGLMVVYNIANAVLYCILAGAMIAVSATAIGLAFGVKSPALSDIFPSSAGWVLITMALGTAFTALAVLGFEKLSKFAAVCAPWVFVVFIAGALAVLPKLGVQPDFKNFWEVATTKVWNGVATPGQDKFGFLHILFFAWFCNLAMHIGLSDMAVFRYAKKWTAGLATAFGVYPGHMLAWMASGIMVAGIGREMNPGRMAYDALGMAGVAGLLLAGWTTANPTLYRAGLALQAITPNWPRWKVTIAAGAVTTVVSCFPVVFVKLLDYVAIYGLVLMPVGAVVFTEHWILPRLGLDPFRPERTGAALNGRALIVWLGTLGVCAFLPIHLYFRWLPGYILAIVSYILLTALTRPKTREG